MSEDQDEDVRDVTKVFACGASSKFNQQMCGLGSSEVERELRLIKIKLAEAETKVERIQAEADESRREAERRQTQLEQENQELRNKVETLYRKNRDISADYEKMIGSLQSDDSNATLRKVVSGERNNNKRSFDSTAFDRSIANSTVNQNAVANGCTTGNASALDTARGSTTVDESVVLFHMKENPLRSAVRDYEQRTNLKQRRLENGEAEVDKVVQLEDEITKLKHHVAKLVRQQERLNANNVEHITRYRESVKLITGYDVKMRSLECVEVSNVYDMANQFSFQRDGSGISVLDNKYAKQWEKTMEKYLGQYHSLPCFTAAVTLELYDRCEGIVRK